MRFFFLLAVLCTAWQSHAQNAETVRYRRCITGCGSGGQNDGLDAAYSYYMDKWKNEDNVEYSLDYNVSDIGVNVYETKYTIDYEGVYRKHVKILRFNLLWVKAVIRFLTFSDWQHIR